MKLGGNAYWEIAAGRISPYPENGGFLPDGFQNIVLVNSGKIAKHIQGNKYFKL